MGGGCLLRIKSLIDNNEYTKIHNSDTHKKKMHTDLTWKPQNGRKLRENRASLYNGYTMEKVTTLSLRVYQPQRALSIYCYNHNYGAAHSLFFSLSLTHSTATHIHHVHTHALKVLP